MGLPAGGHRDEFDRGLPDRAPVGAVHHRFVPHSPGRAISFAFLGTGVEPLLRGMAVLLVYWAMLYWMYRRKLFLRI